MGAVSAWNMTRGLLIPAIKERKHIITTETVLLDKQLLIHSTDQN